MASGNQYSTESVRKLFLAPLAFDHTSRLDDLLMVTNPVWIVDEESPKLLFSAELGRPNVVRIGNKATVRLEVHCYATAVLLTTLSSAFQSMSKGEKQRTLESANKLFRWAVYHDLAIKAPMFISTFELPADITIGGKRQITEDQRLKGASIFQSATAFILLHELRHLEQRHTASTVEIERETDFFAADWLCDAATTGEKGDVERILTLFGIAAALCWITVPEIHLGPSPHKQTHPFGYNRLYQTLERVVIPDEDEHHFVWFLVKQVLLTHMTAAGFQFASNSSLLTFDDSMKVVSDLIDRISRGEKRPES